MKKFDESKIRRNDKGEFAGSTVARQPAALPSNAMGANNLMQSIEDYYAAGDGPMPSDEQLREIYNQARRYVEPDQTIGDMDEDDGYDILNYGDSNRLAEAYDANELREVEFDANGSTVKGYALDDDYFDEDRLPPGWYRYGVREDETDEFEPYDDNPSNAEPEDGENGRYKTVVGVSRGRIHVNHRFDFVTDSPLTDGELEALGCVDEDDWGFTGETLASRNREQAEQEQARVVRHRSER